MGSKLFLAVAILVAVIAVVLLLTRSPTPDHSTDEPFPKLDSSELPAEVEAEAKAGNELATFGGGCFWCVEAVFLPLKGVKKVVSGYSGGPLPDPTYEDICTGLSGHAEVVQITFDPAEISYAELLEVFWRTHDPTTKDRQGNDRGPQYRSVIFTHSSRQQALAEKYKAKIDAAGVFTRPLVTEVLPAKPFYAAETYHQDYYARNPRNGYCRAIIAPKVEKLQTIFRDKLKPK